MSRSLSPHHARNPYRDEYWCEPSRRTPTAEEERAHAFALVWVADFPETTYTDAYCFEVAASEGRVLPWPRRGT